MNNNGKPYIVYSNRLMNHLMELGYKPFATSPNTKFPGKVVYIYNNNPGLINAIEEFLKNK